MRSALEAVRARRFEECVERCQQVLQEQPGNNRAKTMTAISLGQLGRMDEAIQILRAVVQVEPRAIEPLNYLALYLRLSGRLEEAADASRQLIALASGIVDGHNGLGLCLLGLKRPLEAAACFERTIQINPKGAGFHHNLGMAYHAAGRAADAERSLRKAISIDPRHKVSLILLAQILIESNRGPDAAPLLRQAHELDPDSFPGQMNLASAFMEESDPAGALEPLHRAIELSPTAPDPYDQLGSALQQLGRFEEAETYLRKAIELDPVRTRPYFELAYCAKITEEDRPLIDQLKAVASRPDLRQNARANAHYALGKSYDDLKEYGNAMAEYEEANRLLFQIHETAFRPEVHHALFDRIMELYDKRFFEKIRGTGSSSELPVLIVGMIRSGTTLTEQILSSHPKVGAGGESRFWIGDKVEIVHPSNMGAAGERISALENNYLKLLNGLAPGMARVTDKQPLNFSHLGLIHRVFPKARIIHCRRHPVDTCLSIFVTPYRGGLPWGHSKARIVNAYREYLRLMEHWRSVLPKEVFLEIDYSELVADREAVTRRMIDFLGLEWDDACLSHEENVRAVITPSLWQVRQPVYTSSLERWRRYEPWLGEFRDLLTAQELASVKG